MPDSPVAARLRADDLARSPIRAIMELADRDNILAMGLDPSDVISFAGGWVDHAAPDAMRREYERIARDVARFHASGAYSPTPGLPRLRRALVRFEDELHGVSGLSADNVIVGQSSTQLTYCLLTTLLEAGDTVLLFDPAYANYVPQLGVLSDRLDVRALPVLDTDEWQYCGATAIERVERALADYRPKLLLFSSPDNPTGQIISDDAFERVLAAAAAARCIVAVDYAYREQYFSERRPLHFSASPTRHDNLVALHSNSKWCRGLGRRLGWAVARPEIIEALALVQQSVILCPDTLHQEALARYLDLALDDGSLRDYLETARGRYAAAARRVSRCIEEHLQMRYLPPQGGLYTVVDVGRDGDAFVRDVLRETGVIFVPGGGFGATLTNAVRVSFGPLVNDLDLMERGFARVREHLTRASG